MKYSLAVLALLSIVSAEQIQEQKVAPYIDDNGYVVMKQEHGKLNKKSKKTKSKAMDKPSDEVCDGDSADDKELEKTSDKADDIVEDTGFSGSRGHTIRAQVGRRSLAQKKSKFWNGKYSDELANGDISDDKELEDVHDIHDHIVEDWGFSGSRGNTGYRARPQFKSNVQSLTEINTMSNQQLNAMLNSREKSKLKDKPSEYLCDGDSADDKQLNDAADPEDTIVEDFGFSGSRNARGQVRMLQTGIDSMSNAELNSLLNAKAKTTAKDKPSDYICDGDSADDKQIYDAADPEDTIVEDFGFSGSRNARGQIRMLQTEQKMNLPYIGNLGRYSNEIANGDHADDKQLEWEGDPNDLVVDFNGHTNRGYRHTPYDPYDTLDHLQTENHYMFDKAHYQNNNIKDLFPEHFGTIPRDSFVQLEGKPEQAEYAAHRVGEDWGLIQQMAKEQSQNAPESTAFLQLDAGFEDYPINDEHMNILYNIKRYSDGVANGDHADDKELEHEHDPNDLVVDYNGHTNAGYGHTRYDDPEDHFKFDKAHYGNNHVAALFPEHFGTVPKGSTSGKYFG